MGKKVRSAKGEMVDFDYLKIKEQLAAAPPSVDVTERQDFIENRMKRRIKKKLPDVEQLAIEVAPTLPSPDENDVLVEDITASATDTPLDPVDAPITKQKARKKKTP